MDFLSSGIEHSKLVSLISNFSLATSKSLLACFGHILTSESGLGFEEKQTQSFALEQQSVTSFSLLKAS